MLLFALLLVKHSDNEDGDTCTTTPKPTEVNAHTRFYAAGYVCPLYQEHAKKCVFNIYNFLD